MAIGIAARNDSEPLMEIAKRNGMERIGIVNQ